MGHAQGHLCAGRRWALMLTPLPQDTTTLQRKCPAAPFPPEIPVNIILPVFLQDNLFFFLLIASKATWSLSPPSPCNRTQQPGATCEEPHRILVHITNSHKLIVLPASSSFLIKSVLRRVREMNANKAQKEIYRRGVDWTQSR